MGRDGQPLRVQINGRLLLANAGEHVRLAQQNGNLRIGLVRANEDVVLDVGGGSLLSYLKGVSTLTGRDIQLAVRDDIRDEDGGSLALRIVAGGRLDGEAGARCVFPATWICRSARLPQGRPAADEHGGQAQRGAVAGRWRSGRHRVQRCRPGFGAGGGGSDCQRPDGGRPHRQPARSLRQCRRRWRPAVGGCRH
ncbi:hypothetical protein QT383_05565 [Stenotrophomonas rhizophila]